MEIASELLPKIKMVAPGTTLRRALDDIVMAEFGALIVFLDDIKEQADILQGGFYIGAGFSPERLYELAKMDGAIILDESVSRILAANVQLAPDPSLPTNETGMRHRAAERMARQTSKFVLTISRRRRVITLYYKHYKHQLIDITTLIARISQTLDTVERHKTILDKKLLRVEEEEFFEQVQLAQVTELINDGIGILNLLADIEPYVVETGIAGHLSSIRLAIVKTDVEALMQLFVKDYCFQSCSDLEVDKIIDNIKTVSPSDHVKIAYFLGWDVASEAAIHDIIAKPRGYRFLKQVANIPPATADKVVETFSDLISLSKATEEALKEVEGIGEKRAKLILKGVQQMRNRKNYL